MIRRLCTCIWIELNLYMQWVSARIHSEITQMVECSTSEIWVISLGVSLHLHFGQKATIDVKMEFWKHTTWSHTSMKCVSKSLVAWINICIPSDCKTPKAYLSIKPQLKTTWNPNFHQKFWFQCNSVMFLFHQLVDIIIKSSAACISSGHDVWTVNPRYRYTLGPTYFLC